MNQLLAVIRYALVQRPSVLVPVLLPVLVTMLVALAAPGVSALAAAAVAFPAAMVAWGGGVWAAGLHRARPASLMGMPEQERPAGRVLNDVPVRRERAA